MIQGRIGEIDLSDLLRALEAAGKSAVVTLETPRGTGKVHLALGRLVYARTEPGPHLGEYLVRLGYLSLDDIQRLVLKQRRENPGTPLGQLALQAGLISEAELHEALSAQVLEALATMLTWEEGRFTAEGLPPDASQIPLAYTLETSAAVLEAARRLDEWRRGQVAPDEVLVLAGDPTRHALGPEAWTLLELVDGIKRARSIALESGLAEEEAYHVLYELKSRGLLKPATLLLEDPLILVLADSSLVRRLLFVVLERERYRTLIAPDLEAAKRMLARHRPHGILIQGDAVADRVRQIRALPEGRYTPLWVISETPPRGLWARAARVGHIPKPFTERDVLEALSAIRRPL